MTEELTKDSYEAAFKLGVDGDMEGASSMFARLSAGAEIGILRNQISLLDSSMQLGKFPTMPGLLVDLRKKVIEFETRLEVLN